MTIDRLALKRMCLPMGARLYFGGDSDSQSSQTTKNTDARVVGGDASSNASVNDNQGTVNITTTDYGAVNGSFGLAKDALTGALAFGSDALDMSGRSVSDSLSFAGDTVNESLRVALRGIELGNATAKETIAANGDLLAGALRSNKEQAKQSLDTLQDLKSADVRVLVIVGTVVVGLAAAVFLVKKG